MRIPARYLVRRIIERFVLLFAIVNFLFFIFTVLPLAFHINPASFYVPLSYKGISRTQLIQAIDRQWGLNQPLYVQYVLYLRNMLTFNFGYSLTYGEPISALIVQALPIDLIILVPSLLLSTALAVVLGMLSVAKEGKLVDVINSTMAIFTYFIPPFWVFVIILYIFGFELGWFPTNVAEAINGTSGLTYVAALFKFASLPIIILSILSYGVRMILTRNYGVEAYHSYYVTYLKARGIPPRKILLKHVMRNSIIPAVTRTGIDFAFVLAGAVFVEEVFNFYGMGELLVQAAENLNIPVMEAAFYVINFYAIVVLFILDLIYPFIDPRVRYE